MAPTRVYGGGDDTVYGGRRQRRALRRRPAVIDDNDLLDGGTRRHCSTAGPATTLGSAAATCDNALRRCRPTDLAHAATAAMTTVYGAGDVATTALRRRRPGRYPMGIGVFGGTDTPDRRRWRRQLYGDAGEQRHPLRRGWPATGYALRRTTCSTAADGQDSLLRRHRGATSPTGDRRAGPWSAGGNDTLFGGDGVNRFGSTAMPATTLL